MIPSYKHIIFSKEVWHAFENKLPVVALESTIIAHGMPHPENLEFAKSAEQTVRDCGAIPATIAIINGNLHAGLEYDALKYIANDNNIIEKVALRDMGCVIAKKLSGATTVSATMHIAHLAGIKVFATGGIGGVHRGAQETFDVSQDLVALSKIPVIVVSAGAKAILDIPKTLEQLEALAVPVIGYKTDDFPAFYSRKSGCRVAHRCDTSKEIIDIYRNILDLKIGSGLLVANPIPKKFEIPKNIIDNHIDSALQECERAYIEGKEVTPFLLKRIVELTRGESLKTNIALALNNVKLAAEIAATLK